MNVETLIRNKKGTIIDVRTADEFRGGHVEESINIPLQELPNGIDQLIKMSQPLILCCASGNRSGQAATYLSNQGFECYNAGSWIDVNYFQSLKI